jgi:hypothetical protein
MCPAAKNTRKEMKAFIDVAAKPIAARLNSLAPGANLSPREVQAIIQLCPFETVAKESLSPFCSLFTEEDFEIYEYAGDLEKFYKTGYISLLTIPNSLLTVGSQIRGSPRCCPRSWIRE